MLGTSPWFLSNVLMSHLFSMYRSLAQEGHSLASIEGEPGNVFCCEAGGEGMGETGDPMKQPFHIWVWIELKFEGIDGIVDFFENGGEGLNNLQHSG
jgi:hypothetical protein